MKEDAYDSLGKRMKRYEAVSNSATLIPDLPLYARIDGRHFSRLTKGLGYPFLSCEKTGNCWFGFAYLMQHVANELEKEFKCTVVETHSDEISLGWKNIKTAPFEGRYFKLVSNLASFATSVFVSTAWELYASKNSAKDDSPYWKIIQRKPSFDCRVYQVPDLMELTNCFVWRQNDCIRGAINQFAQRFFTHKQLEGKSQDERLQMCLDAGYDFNTESEEIRYGYFIINRSVFADMPEEFKKYHPENKTGKILRSKQIPMQVQDLGRMRNKMEYLFESAAPVYF